MAQSSTLILMPETAYDGSGTANIYTVIGNEQPAAAYYLGNRDLQTVNLKLTNVTGNIIIEASLASTPSSSDWFTVYTLEANINAAGNSAPLLASNAASYTNIEGNFVYLRAKIEDFANGVVNYIKLSY